MPLHTQNFDALGGWRLHSHRRKVGDGEVVNFFAHFDIDGDTSKHVLALADYSATREGVGGWVPPSKSRLLHMQHGPWRSVRRAVQT